MEEAQYRKLDRDREMVLEKNHNEHPVVRCRLQEERAHRSHSRQSWGRKQAPDAPSLPQALSCSSDPYPEEAFYVKRSWFWKVTFASEDSGEEEKHCFQL